MARIQISSLQGPRLIQFRRLLVLVLVLFQAVTVITIIGLTRLGTQDAMLAQARQILANATGESLEHTRAFLDGAQRTAATASSIFATGVVDSLDRGQLENYFVSLLQHHDAFAGMYLGTLEGEFLYVSRDADRELAYRIKRIDADRPGAVVWYRTHTAEAVAVQHEPHDEYDPRTRPWFKAALARADFVWTEPYLFFTDRKLGITAATPVRDGDGKLLGVLGIDLELEDLASFLGAHEISESGSAFIASVDGVLIAAPFAGESRQLASTTVTQHPLPATDKIADVAGREALAAVRKANTGGGEVANFRVEGREYLVDFLPLTLADGRQWLVGTFAPEDEFLQAMRAHERNNIVMALAMLAASMLIGWMLAGTVWTPVAALHDQANRDQLTKVFNRRYLERQAPLIFAEAQRDALPVSVVLIDIDRFKRVNDTHGHGVGDEVIQETARRLRSAARIGDIVARIGGEEFMLLLPTASSEIAVRICERILEWFHDKPVQTGAGPLHITFSAGVATRTRGAQSFDEVRAAADKALYRAKRTGRDRIVVADQALMAPRLASVTLPAVERA